MFVLYWFQKKRCVGCQTRIKQSFLQIRMLAVGKRGHDFVSSSEVDGSAWNLTKVEVFKEKNQGISSKLSKTYN